MFERFTDRARRALVVAQEEARLLNHDYLGTEHMLIGLVSETEGVAAKALASFGIGVDAVRQAVKEAAPSRPSGSATGAPPFTPRAKTVLEQSLRQAFRLGHNYIGTEHLLLALIRDPEGLAAKVLTSLDAPAPDAIDARVIELLRAYFPPPDGPDPPGT
jgi:ATP-dependent Clp protease ATP-binding subunit ClpC